MNENKKKIKYVKCIIAIICCIIIFSFSAIPATASTKQSKGLTYNVIKLLNGNKLSERDLEKLTKKINPVIRKIAHFSIYMILAIVTYMFIEELNIKSKSEKERLRKNIIYTCIFCIIYAIFDEIHQIYVPGRTGKTIDVIIDTLGSCMGIAILLLNNFIKIRCKKP
ncbi:MAG: VanZ family protein [Clostridiales bacterium]|nr:VanZ family protein [Clostridiales bacterium]